MADKIRQGVAGVVIDEHGAQITDRGLDRARASGSPGRSLDDIMAAADEAMYSVKRQVRRRGNNGGGYAAMGPGHPGAGQPGAGEPDRVTVERR